VLLRERGVRIPDDMSLVSFDDIPLFSLYGAGITAVAQPLAAVAETVAGLIESRLSQEGPLHAPQTIRLGCDILLRGSTRKPTAG
jgi:LacI family transcriptional regulator